MASINSQLLVRNDSRINGVNLEKLMTTKLYDLDSGKEVSVDNLAAVIDEIKKRGLNAEVKSDEIPKIVSPTITVVKKPVSLLVNKKMKDSILLENTSLAPSPSVLFSGPNFQRKYKEELLAAFTKVDDARMVDVLMSLSTVYQSLTLTNNSVQLRSSKYKRRLNEIIYVLNWVFKVHGELLSSINEMVYDQMSSEQVEFSVGMKNDKELEPVGDIFEH